MAFPHLFSPIELGNIELPNRIVHVPTDISSSHADGEVSERDIHHHADVARGGTGFVIVGATTPDMKTGRPTVTCLVADGDNYIPGLARLADGMHRYGAKCAVQLQHPGRQCAIPRYNTLGATDRVLKLPWSAGHEIVYENAEEKGKEIRAASIAEILELVDLFSEAAWRVKQAGFDAVELHAAHGYLLSEFMSPFLNRRTDRFGGSFENRMRFPLAVIDSIQKKCGKGFPVLVRYSFDEWCEGGRGLEEGIEIAKVLERAGCAAVDLSMGMQESPGAGFDPMQYPQGWATYAAEAVKKAIRIPVITSHSLRDPDYCEQILAEGRTDLVGLARQILADPYWPVKAQHGKVKSIRRCISCLGGCWQESLMAKKEIACSINAACGNPAYAEMRPTTKPVRVAVVGGGPAGMEAARIATERGHQVTLFEKHAELGGAMLYVCLVPGKEKMRWYLDWIRDQLLDLHVDIRLDHAPTVGGAARLRPRAQRHRRRLLRPRGGRRRLACRPLRGGDGLPEGRLRVPPGRPADAQAGRPRPALGRQLRGHGHGGLPGRHREAGHDRDREPGVRRGLRGHPHVRPAQALRAGRRGGAPLAAVQAPGDGHHEHDGGGDPRRRGGPPGQGLRADDRSRSTTS